MVMSWSEIPGTVHIFCTIFHRLMNNMSSMLPRFFGSLGVKLTYYLLYSLVVSHVPLYYLRLD